MTDTNTFRRYGNSELLATLWRLLYVAAILLLLSLVPRGLSQESSRGVKPTTSLPETKGNFLIAIGVNHFVQAGLPSLRFAVRDAEGVFVELTRPGGLIPLENAFLHTSVPRDGDGPALPGSPGTNGRLSAGRDEIFRQIQSLKNRVPADGLLVVYVATHGVVDRNGRSYFIPENGSIGEAGEFLETSCIAVDSIVKLLGSLNVSKRLLIVDACRNFLGGGRDAAQNSQERFDEALRTARGQIIYSACSLGERALEPGTGSRPIPADPIPMPSEHGLYTHYLLEGLRGGAVPNPDGFISAFTLADFVGKKVDSWCRHNPQSGKQTPWFDVEGSGDIPLALPRAGRPPGRLEQEVPGNVRIPPTPPLDRDRLLIAIDFNGKSFEPMNAAIQFHLAKQKPNIVFSAVGTLGFRADQPVGEAALLEACRRNGIRWLVRGTVSAMYRGPGLGPALPLQKYECRGSLTVVDVGSAATTQIQIQAANSNVQAERAGVDTAHAALANRAELFATEVVPRILQAGL